MSKRRRVGSRCCDEVFSVEAADISKLPCPSCGHVGWLIYMPTPGTWPSEVAPIHVVYFETGGPPWWPTPGELPPPLGAVIVADLISRHGGKERDGWAHVFTCQACESDVVVTMDGMTPTSCANCGGILRNRFAVDERHAFQTDASGAEAVAHV